MLTHHAVAWLDHSEARLFMFSGEVDVDQLDVQATRHPHVRNRAHLSGRREDDHGYYHSIATALSEAREVLIVGPSTAKLELLRHIHKDHTALEPRIVGVETVDHPTDGQLVAFARKYFRRVDRLR